MAVTRRQKEILDFLETFVTRNGYSPSFEEIARGMELKSLATVHKHITNLEKKGLLDRVHNRSRSIDVLPPGTRTRSSDRLPLAGRIAAGLPVEAMENPESISLHDVVGNRDVFALEVRGDSMRDEHIISGDYVLVERTRTARQGEIVVALVHGSETTLKRFYNEGNQLCACSRPMSRWTPSTFRRSGGHSGPRAWSAAQVPIGGFNRLWLISTKRNEMSGHGFTGYGRTPSERQEVSGHGFSRAAKFPIKMRALAPEG
jgi:repressor LexA